MQKNLLNRLLDLGKRKMISQTSTSLKSINSEKSKLPSRNLLSKKVHPGLDPQILHDTSFKLQYTSFSWIYKRDFDGECLILSFYPHSSSTALLLILAKKCITRPNSQSLSEIRIQELLPFESSHIFGT